MAHVLLLKASICTAGYMPATSQPALVARASAPVRMFDVGGAWDSYSAALDTQPLLTKSLTACVLLSGAGCTAQAIEREADAGIDLARVLRFAVFGLVLQGPWNHFFYLLLDGAIPPTPDPFTLTTLGKVGIDQFIQAPIFTIIILYFFAVAEGKGVEYASKQVQ